MWLLVVRASGRRYVPRRWNLAGRSSHPRWWRWRRVRGWLRRGGRGQTRRRRRIQRVATEDIDLHRNLLDPSSQSLRDPIYRGSQCLEFGVRRRPNFLNGILGLSEPLIDQGEHGIKSLPMKISIGNLPLHFGSELIQHDALRSNLRVVVAQRGLTSSEPESESDRCILLVLTSFSAIAPAVLIVIFWKGLGSGTWASRCPRRCRSRSITSSS